MGQGLMAQPSAACVRRSGEAVYPTRKNGLRKGNPFLSRDDAEEQYEYVAGMAGNGANVIKARLTDGSDERL
jgi:hypothetical protein